MDVTATDYSIRPNFAGRLAYRGLCPETLVMTQASAPKEIDRADVLGELKHRFESADPNDALAWVLDELAELDILTFKDDTITDLVGTVGDLASGCPVVKIGPDQWVTVWPGRPSKKVEVFSNVDMRDRKVIGAVPNSPAAEK